MILSKCQLQEESIQFCQSKLFKKLMVLSTSVMLRTNMEKMIEQSSWWLLVRDSCWYIPYLYLPVDFTEEPSPPTNVKINEVWSRSASVAWRPSNSGNSPINKYIIQYWRRQGAPHRLHEFNVSSSQTSTLINNLNPGLSYEMSIIGKGFRL